ncbi:SMK killer toxin resistance protein [Orbilia oligospora]|uniref:SMK killer toxin resistance protein n=1 Tax=Orbilia oligospora TaxID=2813651 RepID=A0A7C8P5W0_ORBOL|nr:SMK killer toxin resistance protein [Orbilia oligospora]KAF3100469.1 SMK killer toxin resistance protein [Orbilia oligospora]KAF3110912.1 SMK killer toxin resistance protein [Orbilia oligospora]KAF3139047.1 SMK killer toxin resistance protein [Orbilia oligospora]KAF3146335.1 SMK killer toxin resistance protein [Orbilia oligospora]
MSYPSDLFRAIFTPGAPPALLLATNVSFACLQLTLLAMLFLTGSFHFFFLSIMCVGVWGGINWFVREVESLRKVEEQAEGIRRVQGILEQEEEERRQQDESEDAGRSTGVEISADEHVERRKVDDDEEDDGFEKVEKEDGYETEGRKSK